MRGTSAGEAVGPGRAAAPLGPQDRFATATEGPYGR